MQQGQPVAFVSRVLNPTEQRYVQIEKEMLAIVHAVEKFHQYIYGREVTVHSDHKPLESILKKSLDRAPKRLQTMMMRLQKYNLSVTYVPGKNLVLADTLSHTFPEESAEVEPGDEMLANVHVTKYLRVTERRQNLICEATEKDDTLMCLRQLVMNGWQENKARCQHWRLHTSRSVTRSPFMMDSCFVEIES